LKDPAEAIEHASINIDAMTLPELKEFAENGWYIYSSLALILIYYSRWFRCLCFESRCTCNNIRRTNVLAR
jgi:hypothetical protein